MLPDRDFMVRATRAWLATGGRATASARTCRRVVARRTRGRSAKPAIRGQEATTSRSVVGAGSRGRRRDTASAGAPWAPNARGPGRRSAIPMWLRPAI